MSTPPPKRDAEDSLDTLVDAFAGMVHELRTPLTGVIGGCDLLDGTELDAAQLRYVQIVRSSAQALLEQVNNMLDLRRSQRAGLVAQSEPLYLYDVLENVFDVVADRAERSNCPLFYDVRPGTPTYIVADESRIRQVVLNLVANAVKFAPSAPVQVHVSAENVTEQTAQLQITVTDRGPGIAPEQVPSLFQPFWQVPDGAHRAEGTGLGLAVSSHVAELLGGTLTYAPGRHGGAAFTLSFPVDIQTVPTRRTVAMPQALVDRGITIAVESGTLAAQLSDLATGLGVGVHVAGDALPDDDGRLLITDDLTAAGERLKHGRCIWVGPVAPWANEERLIRLVAPVRRLDLMRAMIEAVTGEARPSPRTQTMSLNHRKILVVDDAPENRELIAGLLRKWGYIVEEAGDGANACAAFAASSFQGVLLDLQLGEEDGRLVLEDFRRIDQAQGRRTPVAAMTANARPVDVETYLAAGFDLHIPKPITRRELRAAVDGLALWPTTEEDISGSSEPARPGQAGQEAKEGRTDKRPQQTNVPPGPSTAERKARAALVGELRMALLGRDWDGAWDLLNEVDTTSRRASWRELHQACMRRDVDRFQSALDAYEQEKETPADDQRWHRQEADAFEADMLAELLPSFVKQRTRDREELIAAREANDDERIQLIAHRIAGTAAMYGFPTLGDLALKLHQEVTTQDRSRWQHATDEVIAAIERLST